MKTLVNRRFYLGILVKLPMVAVLVFGMIVIGCDDDSNGGGKLDGTWEYDPMTLIISGIQGRYSNMNGAWTKK